MSADKVGRNDPCPCKSGKKFKKCCMFANTLQEISEDKELSSWLEKDFEQGQKNIKNVENVLDNSETL